MFKKKTDKMNLSLGTEKKVCGYVIKKMPLGPYLKTLEKIKTLPETFLYECFPGMPLEEVINKFSTLQEEDLLALFTSMVTVAPKFIISFIADLTDIDENCLINDEKIGIDGLIQLIKAFIEVNQLGKSLQDAGELIKMLKQILTPNIGSNA